jgi:hypothetical protein
VYDARRELSDLVVLDARDLRVAASVRLGHRIPFGFHGTCCGSRSSSISGGERDDNTGVCDNAVRPRPGPHGLWRRGAILSRGARVVLVSWSPRARRGFRVVASAGSGMTTRR